MATIKHLIGNEQEMWRMYNIIQPAYSANIGTFSHASLYMRLWTNFHKMIEPCMSCTFGRSPRESMPA